jgi:prepilin-type N-terminal cleavage/methylation domain-containing protein
MREVEDVRAGREEGRGGPPRRGAASGEPYEAGASSSASAEPAPARREGSRKAFTVIELITVLAVLSILMGILVPVISGMKERARRKLAESRLKAVCIALDRYFAELGVYPPDTGYFRTFVEYSELIPADFPAVGDDPDGDGWEAHSLYYYLCGPKGGGIKVGADRIYGPYHEPEKDEVRVVGNEDLGECVLLDLWGRPYFYEENRSHSLNKTLNEAQKDALLDPTHHAGHYDIFSVGADGKANKYQHDKADNDGDHRVDEEKETNPDDTDALPPDDITNW